MDEEPPLFPRGANPRRAPPRRGKPSGGKLRRPPTTTGAPPGTAAPPEAAAAGGRKRSRRDAGGAGAGADGVRGAKAARASTRGGGGILVTAAPVAEGAPYSRRPAGLTGGRVTVGMRLLGVVSALTQTAVVVALPFNLTAFAAVSVDVFGGGGRVPRPAAAGGRAVPLAAAVTVGQLVRVVVTSISTSTAPDDAASVAAGGGDPKALSAPPSGAGAGAAGGGSHRRRLEVSLTPSDVNGGVCRAAVTAGAAAGVGSAPLAATVASVQEHGYVLHLGAHFGELTAFLRFADAPGGKAAPVLQRGTLVNVVPVEGATGGADDATAAAAAAAEAAAAKSTKAATAARKRAEAAAAATAMAAARIRSVRVTARPAAVAAASVPRLHPDTSTLAGVLPGAVVTVKLTSLEPGRRAVVGFLGVFVGSIEGVHLGVDGGESLHVGDRLPARVLYVDVPARAVGLTLLPSLVGDYAAPSIPAVYKVGAVVPTVRVAAVVPSVGVFFYEPASATVDGIDNNSDEDPWGGSSDSDESDARRDGDGGSAPMASAADKLTVVAAGTPPLFAHISRLVDGEPPRRLSRYRRGRPPPPPSTGSVRVVGRAPLDGVVNVDARLSTLARTALRLGDLPPGAVVSTVIHRHTPDGGLVVAIEGDDVGLRGYVPKGHVSDGLVRSLGRHPRLAVGKALRCRVLAVEAGSGGGRGRATLTARRSLVDAPGPALASYAQAAEAFAAARAAAAAGIGAAATPASAASAAPDGGWSEARAPEGAPQPTAAPPPATFVGHVVAMATTPPGGGDAARVTGALVSFYSGVRAFVPVSEWGTARGDSRTDMSRADGAARLPIGTAVPVRLLSVDAPAGRVLGSLDVTGGGRGDVALTGVGDPAALAALTPGVAVASVTVVRAPLEGQSAIVSIVLDPTGLGGEGAAAAPPAATAAAADSVDDRVAAKAAKKAAKAAKKAAKASAKTAGHAPTGEATAGASSAGGAGGLRVLPTLPADQAAAGITATAYLHPEDLSDSHALAAAAAKRLTPGTVLHHAMVLVAGGPPAAGSISAKPRRPVVTFKPSLIAAAAAGTLPTSVAEVVALLPAAPVGMPSTGAAAAIMESDDDSDSPATDGGASSAARPTPTLLLAGYIKSSGPAGVRVGFGGTASAYAPIRCLSDDFVTDVAGRFPRGTSVTVAVTAADAVTGTMTVSLRASDVAAVGEAAVRIAEERLRGYFRSRSRLVAGRRVAGLPRPGAVIGGVVTSVRPYGAVVQLDGMGENADAVKAKAVKAAKRAKKAKKAEKAAAEDAMDDSADTPAVADADAEETPTPTVTAIAVTELAAGAAVGETVRALVLDVDPLTGVVDLALTPALVAAAAATPSAAAATLPASPVTATVQLVKDEYAVLTLAPPASGRGDKKKRRRGKDREVTAGLVVAYAAAREANAPEGVTPLVVGTELSATLLPSVAADAATDAKVGEDDDLAHRVLVRVDLAATAAAARQVSVAACTADDRAVADTVVAVAASSKGRSLKTRQVSKESLAIGDTRTGTILSVQPLHANVYLGRFAMGRIHATTALADVAPEVVSVAPNGPLAADEGRLALHGLTVGAAIKVKVVALKVKRKAAAAGGARKPAADGKQIFAELSRDLTPGAAQPPDTASLWAAMTPGSRRVGVVKCCAIGGALLVSFSQSLSGRVKIVDGLPRGQRAAVAAAAHAVNSAAAAAAAEATGEDGEKKAIDDASAAAAFGPAATPGRRVVVEVITAMAEKKQLRLSMAVTVPPRDGGDEDGDGWVAARVMAVFRWDGLLVMLPAKTLAFVPLTALVATSGLTASLEALATYKRGLFLTVRLVGGVTTMLPTIRNDTSKSRRLAATAQVATVLTPREEAARAATSASEASPPNTAADLRVGDTVCAVVTGIGKSGCFVSVSRTVTGRILLGNLSDGFVKDVTTRFTPGMVLPAAKVISIDAGADRVELSLRTSQPRVAPDTSGPEADRLRASLAEGVLVTATVRSVAVYGALVNVDGLYEPAAAADAADGVGAPPPGPAAVRALLHVTEMTEPPRTSGAIGAVMPGARLVAVVIRVAHDQGKVWLCTKRPYLEAAGLEGEVLDAVVAANAIRGEEPAPATGGNRAARKAAAREAAAAEAAAAKRAARTKRATAAAGLVAKSAEESSESEMELETDSDASSDDNDSTDNTDGDDDVEGGDGVELVGDAMEVVDASDDDDDAVARAVAQVREGDSDDASGSDSGSGSDGDDSGSESDDDDSGSDSESDDDDSGSDSDSGDDDSGSDSDSSSDSDGRGAARSDVAATVPPAAVTALPISGGFDFGGDGSGSATAAAAVTATGGDDDDDDATDDGGSSTDASTSDEGVDGTQSAAAKRAARATAARTARDGTAAAAALSSSMTHPETAADYERLVAGDPHSSQLWTRYMALHLSLSDVAAARAVAERGLAAIPVEAERERVNLWTARVHLEAAAGGVADGGDGGEGGGDTTTTPLTVAGEPLSRVRALAVLDRAVRHVTDVKSFLLRVAGAVRQTDVAFADAVLSRATRTFRTSAAVWVAAATAAFAAGDAAGGRALLQTRALQAVPSRKHTEVTIALGGLEYKSPAGDPERGRTLFEGLVANAPKRLDVWNVYTDAETRVLTKRGGGTGDDALSAEAAAEAVARVRRLYERQVTLPLSSKKMRFVFKRWLGFEARWGGDDAVAHVREQARAYVESKME